MLQRGNAILCYHSVMNFEAAVSHFLSFNVLGGGFMMQARPNGITTLEHGNEKNEKSYYIHAINTTA
jgi:hypothetical protein